MQVLDLRVVRFERFPCRKLDHSRRGSHVRCSLLLVDYEPVTVRAARGRLPSCHIRNPPKNALALLPARQPFGSSLSCLTLPPPRTTSSGSRAATKAATTASTFFLHFFLPTRSNARAPT